ncbi:Uncharacterised protein [Shewanella morhuae]|uniref:Uncharacterized protein n=1 Tax=Shewanella morhuae TaxID=365591 RepID=A0A380BUH2_9GAMM|nr:Uncharacterised protein [Shewanella morhuae]
MKIANPLGFRSLRAFSYERVSGKYAPKTLRIQ